MTTVLKQMQHYAGPRDCGENDQTFRTTKPQDSRYSSTLASQSVAPLRNHRWEVLTSETVCCFKSQFWTTGAVPLQNTLFSTDYVVMWEVYRSGLNLSEQPRSDEEFSRCAKEILKEVLLLYSYSFTKLNFRFFFLIQLKVFDKKVIFCCCLSVSPQYSIMPWETVSET